MIISDWTPLYPFQSHFAAVGGKASYKIDAHTGDRFIGIDTHRKPLEAYHYIDEYTGTDPDPPVLLFVHGNPTWSFHWRNLILALRSSYRCIAPDHLGCGLSAAPNQTFRLADRIVHLRSFITAMKLRRVTLIAQDWGGAIGLGAATFDPLLFERFILFNTGAFPPPLIPWRIRVCRFPFLGRLAVQGGNLFNRAALTMTMTMRTLSLEVKRGYLAPYHQWRRRKAVYDFVDDIPHSPRHPSWQRLADIESNLPSLADRPFLFVWGMRDWCFTPACLDKFIELLPSADIVRIADAGHWVVEDAPEEVLQYVEVFLTGEDNG